MRLIIIGASGMIGTAVDAAARKAGHWTVGTYATKQREGLRQFDMTKQSILDVVPDLGAADCVLLMSAMIDQSWVQSHAWESHRINFLGAVECANAALERRAHFVFMSSEAVFGGSDVGGCDEAAFPVPLTLYAQQKVKVEQRLPRDGTCIVRTGSVVNWEKGGRCAVSGTYRALLQPGAAMAHDNLLTVTDIDDVAAGLVRIAERRTCGTVHLAANPAATRTQLADHIIERSRFGARMSYQKVTLAALPSVNSGRAWLRSGRATELGLTFADPRSVVERKVAILDQET